jgi:hypothetical protein
MWASHCNMPNVPSDGRESQIAREIARHHDFISEHVMQVRSTGLEIAFGSPCRSSLLARR